MYEKETRKAKHEKGIYSSSCVAVLLLSAASVQWTHAEVVAKALEVRARKRFGKDISSVVFGPHA